MSFTKDDINIIREKLSGVETPSVDEAWKRMEEMMESPPAQTGTTPRMGLRYYVVLNSIVGALLVTSAVLYFGVSNANQQQALHTELPTSTVVLNPMDELSFADHSNDLLVPEGPAVERIQEETMSSNVGAHSLSDADQVAMDVSGMTAENFGIAEATEPTVASTTKTPSSDEALIPFGLDGLNGIGFQHDEVESRERWRSEDNFRLSIWGLHLGVQFAPAVQPMPVYNYISGGLFYRHYMNPGRAVQGEINYNSVVIRPHTFVSQRSVAGNSITDSSIVRQYQYVSLAGMYHHRLNQRLVVKGGLQAGYLARLSGDRFELDPSSGSSEFNEVSSNHIQNTNIVQSVDLASLVEVGLRMDSWEFDLRWQKSLRNQTAVQAITTKHSYSSVQIKVAHILGMKN